MSPSMFWLEAFIVTWPPLLPSLPQPAAAARRNTPSESSLTIVAPVRSIVAVVLLTKKISPFRFVSVPPFMAKDASPSSASPDMDW